jgi:hypothetical protein
MNTKELITKAAAEILMCERPSRVTSAAMLEMLKMQSLKITELENAQHVEKTDAQILILSVLDTPSFYCSNDLKIYNALISDKIAELHNIRKNNTSNYKVGIKQ